MQKFMILFLSFLLGSQSSNALPTPDNSNTQITNLTQLAKSAGETYVDFFQYAVEKYKELFDKVLTISKKDAESDAELKAALRPFVDYVSKMNDNHDRSKKALQSFFHESTELADKYDRGVPVDASDADHKIAKYMDEAYAMKTKFDILINYINTLQQFANNVRQYLKSLPEDERLKEKKLRLWYINWQHEHDWKKKNDLMVNFFELLDDRKDDRERLMEKVVRNAVIFLNEVITVRKNMLKKVIKNIETEIKNPDSSTKYALDVMKGFVARAESIQNLNRNDEHIEKIRLFGAIQDIKSRFKQVDLSEQEKEIAKIMDKNGEVEIEVREILLAVGFTEEVLKDIEEYVDTRNEEEKENKVKELFENVQDEKDLEKKTYMLLGLLLS